MNAKQIKQLKIVFGVVVFLGVGNSCGLISDVINPGRLKAFVAGSMNIANKDSSVAEEEWNIGMLPDELDHFDAQLDTIQDELAKHNEELAKVKEMIVELRDRDPSDPYLLQLEEVKKALLMLKDRLVEIEKSNKNPVNVNQHVNVNVGGNGDAALGAISTAGYVFSKLCDAVKCFGPSIVNYYIVSQAFGLIREHRDAMAAMMIEMQRMMAEQAARAGQENTPPPPQSSNQGAMLGESLMNAAAYAAFILPLLYKMLQGVSSQFPKSDAVPVLVPTQPEPRAWRILGGQRIPVR